MIIRVARAALEVPDPVASVAFFQEHVGLAVRERAGDVSYLHCADAHYDLAIMPSPDRVTRFHHLALEVAPGTLDAAVDRAVAAGATSLGEVPEPGAERAVVVQDPIGFRYKLLAGASRMPPPAPLELLPRPVWFSHVNLATPDLGAITAFLTDGLGMRPSDVLGAEDDPLLVWFHCDVPGALHHGIAVIQKPEPGLHHLAFDFASVQDLSVRADHYVGEDRFLVWGIGRHGAGGSVFAYLEDPSGLMIECGNGMIRCGQDPRWSGPGVWGLEDPRGVDLWGSRIPEPWIDRMIPLSTSTQVAV